MTTQAEQQRQTTNFRFRTIANNMIASGEWGEFYRPALFIDSNHCTRQIIYLAAKEKSNEPLLGCNTIIMGSEMLHILDTVGLQIGEHTMIFNTYDGIYLGKWTDTERTTEKIPQ